MVAAAIGGGVTERKASGRQVSYPKAVDAAVDALLECGVDREQATLLAEKHMRLKLSAKQLAELEASEREDEPEPEPAPMVLPAMVMDPPVAAVPDPTPAAEDEPHVTIFQRQRGECDELIWVEIDKVATRAQPGVALTLWLNDQYPEPLTGRYRAEGNGGHAEDDWRAEAA